MTLTELQESTNVRLPRGLQLLPSPSQATSAVLFAGKLLQAAAKAKAAVAAKGAAKAPAPKAKAKVTGLGYSNR